MFFFFVIWLILKQLTSASVQHKRSSGREACVVVIMACYFRKFPRHSFVVQSRFVPAETFEVRRGSSVAHRVGKKNEDEKFSLYFHFWLTNFYSNVLLVKKEIIFCLLQLKSLLVLFWVIFLLQICLLWVCPVLLN